MPDSFRRAGSDADASWQALLHQLRQQPKVQPQPFFYARVRARLAAQADAAGAWWPAWLRRPAYAALLAAMVVAFSGDGSTTAALLASRTSSYPALHPPR